jgi:VWFA-related protein
LKGPLGLVSSDQLIFQSTLLNLTYTYLFDSAAQLSLPGSAVMILMIMRKAIYICWTICFALEVSGQIAIPPGSTRMVPVPALVEVRSGEIAYDLSASDFSIKDEGVEQQVELGNTDSRPRSLRIVLRTGRNASAQLGKINHLNDLLSTMLTGPIDQVGILTFDSRPHVVQDFAVNSDAVSHSLTSIVPGDTGAALFDALHAAVAMFPRAPATNRRFILLISRQHDHGSIASSAAPLIRSISPANVSIYGLTFTAPRKDLLRKLWSTNPLAMTASAMQRSAVEALARLTGGDFYRFDTDKSFEDRVVEMTNHIHNSYCIMFQPNDPAPGFHSLQVGVRRSKTTVVAARSGYWFSAKDDTDSEAKAQ